MKTKTCSKCKEEKPIEEFSARKDSKDGYRNQCKLCATAKKKLYIQKNKVKIAANNKKYWQKNKLELTEKNKLAYIKNRTERVANQKIYYEKHRSERITKQKEYSQKNKVKLAAKAKVRRQKNKVKLAAKRKEYNQKNKVKVAARHKLYREKHKVELVEKNRVYALKRRHTDISYKLTLTLRGRLSQALKGNLKAATTLNLLGCSIEQFKQHLEDQFTEGMTWDNHSMKGWHIDHIKPCAAFDMTDPEQQKECFYFSNMQPLWAEDNFKKRDKY